MSGLELGVAMRAAQSVPDSVPGVIAQAARGLGATDVVVYLVDFAQTTLEPMPDRAPHGEVPRSEPVVGSLAGRTFTEWTTVTADRPDGTRVWVPLVEGSDRTGVLAFTVPTIDGGVLESCEELGLFAGYLIATHSRSTDFYNLRRRRRALSLAASLQWDLLPPLILKTPRLTVAGVLEPAYDVGGDSFDYALNDTVFNVAIIDALGHGMESSLIAALAVGAYRHDRREGASVQQMHERLDATITNHYPKMAFATGQLAQIDVETGAMVWTNAGHPPPMLLRGGKVVAALDCPPTPPWGVGSAFATSTPTTVATEALEPGDSVLFYTDGVVEAHARGGEAFGVDRLIDVAGRHASDRLEPEEVIRQIVRSVLAYRDGALDDDATLVIVRWNGPPT